MDPNRLMRVAPQTAPAPSVLVVDDEDIIRRLLKTWLERSGYRVRTAAAAVPALELSRAEPPDVAVCDIRMPGPSGAWLIDQLRREMPGTAVVVITGMSELDPSLTLGDGIVGYLAKPLRHETLLETVSAALRYRPSGAGPASPDTGA